MKQTQEFYGKNVDDAVEKACISLNIPKNNLTYDVISSGSTGIFGIVGVKKARIRVTLPDKNDGSQDKSRNSDTGMAGVMSIVDEAFGEDQKTEKPSFKSKPPRKRKSFNASAQHNAGKQNRKKAEAKSAKKMVKDSPSEEAPDTPQMSPKDVSGVPEEQLKPEKNFSVDFNDGFDERDEGYPPKYKDEVAVDVSPEAMELGRKTLQKMVDLMTEDATVVAETDQDRLLLKVEGGNSGVLIGRRGQTLEAMQFLTDKIINRFSESRVRLKVDIEGYMETRKANLKSLAYKMADKAKKTGKPATINQMTAQDRRIVHLTLKDDARVRTQSMGDGYYRRLVIFPKKGSYKKRRSYKK